MLSLVPIVEGLLWLVLNLLAILLYLSIMQIHKLIFKNTASFILLKDALPENSYFLSLIIIHKMCILINMLVITVTQNKRYLEY